MMEVFIQIIKPYLTVLVEGHDDDGGAVPLDDLGLVDEVLLALLQRDRVHDAFALATLQTGLHDLTTTGEKKEFNIQPRQNPPFRKK